MNGTKLLRAVKVPFFRKGTVPAYYISSKIKVIRISGKGLGVAATECIKKGELIECSPVIVLKPGGKFNGHWKKLFCTILETLYTDHYYWWTTEYGALVLGYGSLYNHSNSPNMKSINFVRYRRMAFYATQDIEPNEEITRRYRAIWFDHHEQK